MSGNQAGRILQKLENWAIIDVESELIKGNGIPVIGIDAQYTATAVLPSKPGNHMATTNLVPA